MAAGDLLVIALSLLPVALAIAGGVCFAQKVPTRLRVYRFHAILYTLVVALGLLAWMLMGVSTEIDWWLNDGTILLELLFGIVGVALCVVLAPEVWWLERHPDSAKAWRAGSGLITAVTLMPYPLVFGLLLFYRE